MFLLITYPYSQYLILVRFHWANLEPCSYFTFEMLFWGWAEIFSPEFKEWGFQLFRHKQTAAVLHWEYIFFFWFVLWSGPSILDWELLLEVTSHSVKVTQSCLTLCDPINYTVHGILWARILEWVAIPFSRGTSQPRNRTGLLCIAGGFFTSWAITEAPSNQWEAWKRIWLAFASGSWEAAFKHLEFLVWWEWIY